MKYTISRLWRDSLHKQNVPEGIKLLRTRLKDIKNLKHVPRKLEEILAQY